ncbi:MAG: DNA-directed RNA polymerase subunit beta [Ignavibacteria bacterium GWF2_33_9]|nr:MAG: DNA-directed RNA polymerase subunit beta [Ignavibacteria bacterium GWF2_33_9]
MESDSGIIRLRRRIDFSRFGKTDHYPDLLDIQIRSYKDFLQDDVLPSKRGMQGLQKVFNNNFPIEDASSVYQLEFVEYSIERPKYSEKECRERELTFSKPLKAKLRLSSKADPESEDFIEAVEQEVYLGNIPAMTNRGTFIINGAERIIVSQIHRSPGVFFDDTMHPNGMRIYSARIIPLRGSWVEFTTDIHEVLYCYVDRKKKFPATSLLRALGFSSDVDILKLFDLMDTVNPEDIDESHVNRRVASDIVDLNTGEIIASRDAVLTEALYKQIKATDILPISFFKQFDPGEEPVIAKTLQKDTTRNREEALETIYRTIRTTEPPDLETAAGLLDKLFFTNQRYDLGAVGRFKIKDVLHVDIADDVHVLTITDFVEVIRHLLYLHDNKLTGDDIDHLGNRRVRTVGEQFANQFNIGLARMARTIKEKLGLKDNQSLSPTELVNARTISSVINQFFGTNQLSQFMDQTNPLAELTHKRRVSALGPGGLSRERAGFEVRDVHYTHYGRLCPIETPEGPNIGLISSLAIHSDIDELGFIITPYKKVIDGIVTDEIVYLTADEEDAYTLIPASTRIEANGKIVEPKLRARKSGDFVLVTPEEVNFMDISTDQISSAAASLIPFLEHDDANRALMGSNMQRQAVPLLRPNAPIVGTGMEARVAKDSRSIEFARGNGYVKYVSGDKIIVEYDDERDERNKYCSWGHENVISYELKKFERTNQDTTINHKPLVKQGQKVVKGTPLVDNSSSEKGELALGKNVLVAFMPWRGYNFEDAIIISQKLVAEDVFTSVHIEEFTLQVRDTKRGEEEFTREIPNVSEEAVKDLDEKGIIHIGAKVKEGDILIGKITPKGETDPTPEEKLLRAIFGDKAGDVKDVSLKATPGLRGIVMNTKVFSRRQITQDKLTKEKDKKAQENLNKKEKSELAALDNEVIARLGKYLNGQVTLGIKLKNGVQVFRNGAKVSEERLLEAYTKSMLKPEFLDPDADYLADEEKNTLIKDMLSNFINFRTDKKNEYRAEKNKIASGDELPPGILEMAKVYIAKKRKLQVGDKMAGRHGNKGIVSKVVHREDMPFLPDGQPVDIVLNPLGVPSRMNLGQLYETALGWAGQKLGVYFSTPIFDGATWDQVGDFLEKAGLPRSGKTPLFDGRTGEPFKEQVTIGVIYMLKLSHMVDDKMHARSIGPYSLITQQPLGGKAQFGGQRLGEMEVWALEAYGASNTLQEMLTVKSDDVPGRSRMYESIVKGDNAPDANVPESFKVLVRELQGLALDVVYK